MAMIIYQREPVFTIGQAPFVAGAIHVRNQIRALKQREKARRRKALVERFPLLRVTLPRFASPGRNLPPSSAQRVGDLSGGPNRTSITGSPATAKA